MSWRIIHRLLKKCSEMSEIGGGALGSDTMGAATRDCTAAKRARAKMSLLATWMEGSGPETGAGGQRRRGAAKGRWEEATR